MAETLPRPHTFTLCNTDAPLPVSLHGAVIAIGNFDGVHRGHRAVLAEAQALAATTGGPCAVLTFEPHPRTFFKPDQPVFLLTPTDVKAQVLARFGLDGMIVARFDADFAATSADDFIDKLLIGHLKAGGIVVGPDFHFGRGRAGTPALLAQRGQERGLPVRIAAPFEQEGDTVSSSLIRTALAAGDLARANKLLGYRWFVRGEVRHGDKRGRLLGYPTANLALADNCTLKHGIYAVRVAAQGRIHDGVASFGRRPMFDNGAPLLEPHLFDFSGDLYGQEIDVEFVGWIRGEETFASTQALIAQMDADSEAARALITRTDVASMIG